MVRKFSRREVLKTSTALAITTVFAEPICAAAPRPKLSRPGVDRGGEKGRQADLVCRYGYFRFLNG